MRKLGFNATGTVETPGTRANRGWGTSRAWAGACRRTLPRAPGLQSLAWCIAEVGQNPLNYNFLAARRLPSGSRAATSRARKAGDHARRCQWGAPCVPGKRRQKAPPVRLSGLPTAARRSRPVSCLAPAWSGPRRAARDRPPRNPVSLLARCVGRALRGPAHPVVPAHLPRTKCPS